MSRDAYWKPRLLATSTDPWSIRPPGVVWEFIARTKTASGHLYRGLRSYGPGISVRLCIPFTGTVAMTDPWSIGDIGILDNNQLANGPGISESNYEKRI